MHRGSRKDPVFLCDADRYSFLDTLDRANCRFGIEINGYCLMGNHYHLLVHAREGQLSRAMQYINGVFTQRFNRRHGFDGALFRGRFASKLVETDGYLDRVVRYIHRNPMEIGFSDRLEDYRWSSYPSFLRGVETLPLWLSAEAIWASGPITSEELRRRTEGRTVVEDIEPRSYPEVIGTQSFVSAALHRASVDVETIGHLRTGTQRPSIEQIEMAAKAVLASRPIHLEATAFDLRLLCVGLSQELGGLTLSEIALSFGYGSPQSAGNAVHRFRKRLLGPLWGLTVEQIRKELAEVLPDDRCR